MVPPGEAGPLTKRKISQKTAERYGYTQAKIEGQPVQIAAYRNAVGEVVAQHVRGKNKEFFWRGSPKKLQLFGQHLFRGGGKRLIITEGEIDCMTIAQYVTNNKWPTVSITSGASNAHNDIRNNLEFVESFDEVIFAFDMDEPGREAAKKCAVLLTPGKAKILNLPLKDANDMVRAGRTKELVDACWQAVSYRPDGIINGADLLEEMKKPPPKGLEIPFPELYKKILGLRKGELVLCTAGSGIGKSTFVNELAMHLFKEHGQSLGILALEENPVRTGRRYVSIQLNKPIHLSHEGVSDEEIEQAFKETLGTGRFWLYDHFGSTDIDNLMHKLRYMVLGLGVDFIILDHISIVVSGLDEIAESERKIIDKLMTRLRSLVEETGIGCLAVVHLKRPDGGKSFNRGRQVSLTDLRGSGSLEQFSDIVIALERDQQGDSPDLVLIRVLKNRPVGDCGEAGYAKYWRETGRLLSYDPFERTRIEGDF
jgi:twinkle protein